jgi:hypothetical protein
MKMETPKKLLGIVCLNMKRAYVLFYERTEEAANVFFLGKIRVKPLFIYNNLKKVYRSIIL